MTKIGSLIYVDFVRKRRRDMRQVDRASRLRSRAFACDAHSQRLFLAAAIIRKWATNAGSLEHQLGWYLLAGALHSRAYAWGCLAGGDGASALVLKAQSWQSGARLPMLGDLLAEAVTLLCKSNGVGSLMQFDAPGGIGVAIPLDRT